MKANELSCKDIMVGDWVNLSKGNWSENRQVELIDIEMVAEGVYLAAPIPLTPEILEKNGFKPQIPQNHIETVYACQDISEAIADELYALWPYLDGSYYLLLRVNGKDKVRIDARYVHQLQHALGLCEIDKTIEL